MKTLHYVEYYGCYEVNHIHFHVWLCVDQTCQNSTVVTNMQFYVSSRPSPDLMYNCFGSSRSYICIVFLHSQNSIIQYGRGLPCWIRYLFAILQLKFTVFQVHVILTRTVNKFGKVIKTSFVKICFT